MPTSSQFTPSASVTFTTNQFSAVFALPTVDGSNVATIVSNAGPGVALLAFASTANPGLPGTITVPPGTDQQLPSGAATQTQIAAASTSTFPAVLTIQRGTTSTKWNY